MAEITFDKYLANKYTTLVIDCEQIIKDTSSLFANLKNKKTKINQKRD